ncbi:E3 ISG15--protein ligase herc5 [Chytriomyces hyalinus]|nr:E3 ISG15--protein ligase herc5 [Chytriomyces hyalinus]
MSTTCHFRGFTQTGPSAAHSFTVENDEGVGVSWNKLHVLRSESGLPSPAVSIPEPLGGKVAFVLEGSMLWAVLLDGARSRTLVHPSVVSFAALKPVLLPTPSSLTRIVKICAGYSHYLGLSDRGQLLSWGQNDLRGQLGHGHMNTQEHAPSLVEALDGLAVTDIACGGNHSVVVVDGSIVYTL